VSRSGTRREAVKSAKRKLHQVYGAYVCGISEKHLQVFIKGLPSAAAADRLRPHVTELLSTHSSTRERLPLLEHLYDRIFGVTGVPSKILDVACGLHPLEIPWMSLAAGTMYVALDIDRRQAAALNMFLPYTGLSARAECWDILVEVPPWQVDVAFVLKTWPCLERQEPGAGSTLVNSLSADWVVVSFPTQSLSGSKRRMGLSYRRHMAEVSRSQSWEITELSFPQEIFFLIRKPPPSV
jgi:16S rRNA (guanine(1405)-N(7))-methyltransferase